MKQFNRAIMLGGEAKKVGTPTVTVLETNASHDVVRAKGTTVPTDADRGYAVGCIFIKTDGSAGTTIYINEGTATSADFNAVKTPSADPSFSGNVTIGDAAGDTLTLNSLTTVTTDQKIQFRDTGIYINSSSDGVLNIVSDTSITISGAATLTGALTVGVDGTGHDVKLYSATASNSWLWDESADKVVQTFVTDSTSTVEPHTITSTLTGVGVTGGRFKHALTINAAAGSYTNAIKGDVTYGASGKTTGLGSAVLAEMTLSAGTVDGTYAAFEAEINFGSNSPIGTNTSFAYFSANGTPTDFLTSGHILNLQGLGAATTGKIFQANTAAAATHALRILIGSVPYYIMLTDTGA